MLSAMHNPIEASSVHTATLPERPYNFLLITALWISLKLFLTIPCPFLSNYINSVEEPSASAIAIPMMAAVPLEYLRGRRSSDEAL
jgi:hypothetical protein